jgi:transposase
MERERPVARPTGGTRFTAVTLITTIKDFSNYHTVKMKNYSIDFRHKIREVYHNEPLSQRAIANRFCGASQLRKKLLCTVSWDQKYCSWNWAMRSQIKTECKLLIWAELIEASDDATLEELRYLLYQKIGFTISIATMVRMAKLLNMTWKKNSVPLR